MGMKKNILFITGKLAEKNLKKILDCIEEKDFSYEIRNLNINVAALLTTEMIYRRIGNVETSARLYCLGRLEAI